MISEDKRGELYGLVLAGGKSVRMGQDKAAMQWHGKEQRYYMADLLNKLCTAVYISCRREQEDSIAEEYNALPDNGESNGPLTGILSAQQHDPRAAWLVVACDLPLMDRTTLEYLIEHRNKQCIATTYRSPYDGLPEPLITIWEPESHELLKQHIAEGYKCPRKALIKNEAAVQLLTPQNPDALKNANTPEDAREINTLMK